MRRLLTNMLIAVFLMGMLPCMGYAQFPKSGACDFDDGETLDESEIDDICNDIVNDRDPDYTNDISNDNTEWQATTAPTSRPTTLTGELQQIRYMIGALAGDLSNWYSTIQPYDEGYYNLVYNGGLEYWDNGVNSAPDGWTIEGGATIARTNGDQDHLANAFAIEITSAGATSNGIYYTLSNLKASTKYQAWAWAKATSSDTALFSTSGASTNFITTTSSTSWVKVTGTFTTDSTPTNVLIKIGSNTSGDIVYFDQIMVAPGRFNRQYIPHINESVPPDYIQNLVVKNTSLTTVSVTADYLTVENSTYDRYLLRGVNVTADVTASSAGGIDNGSEAAISYGLFVVLNPSTGDVNTLLSSDYADPLLPSGYTFKRRVSHVNNGESTSICTFQQYGNYYQYTHQMGNSGELLVANSPSGDSNVTVDLEDSIGPSDFSHQVLLQYGYLYSTSDHSLYVCPANYGEDCNGIGKYISRVDSGSTRDFGEVWVTTGLAAGTNNGVVFYNADNGSGIARFTAYVSGFMINL